MVAGGPSEAQAGRSAPYRPLRTEHLTEGLCIPLGATLPFPMPNSVSISIGNLLTRLNAIKFNSLI